MKPKIIATKKCLECGGIFSKKPTESRKYWAKKKYCSFVCSLVHTTIKKQRNSEKPTLGIEPWNKGTIGIMKPNSTSFKKGHKMNVGIPRPDMLGEKNPLWKPKKVRRCAYCKKELSLVPWQMKNRKRFFCNRDCWAKGTRGVGSPVFKGDKAISKIRSRIGALPHYAEWRKSILNRDKWTCQICGSKRNLEVDHLKRFLHIIEENVITSPIEAVNCKELWDIANGRTLCRKCHRTTDTYGTKGLKKLST